LSTNLRLGGLFVYGRGHHETAWGLPGSTKKGVSDLSYCRDLALAAETAKLDSIFFADQFAPATGRCVTGWVSTPFKANSIRLNRSGARPELRHTSMWKNSFRSRMRIRWFRSPRAPRFGSNHLRSGDI